MSFVYNFAKNVSNKYRGKHFDYAKRCATATDKIKTASKRVTQITGKVATNIIANKIRQKIIYRLILKEKEKDIYLLHKKNNKRDIYLSIYTYLSIYL